MDPKIGQILKVYFAPSRPYFYPQVLLTVLEDGKSLSLWRGSPSKVEDKKSQKGFFYF
jgi:hypothetical protein